MAPRQPGKAPARTTKTPARVVVDPDVPPEPTDALRREAHQLDTGNWLVPLGPSREMVEVTPYAEWRSSAMRLLNNGDFEGWAEQCLTDDGYDVWADVNPTNAEVQEFFADFRAAGGITPLGSRASRRASMRTRGR